MGLGLVQKFQLTRNAEPYPEHEGEYFVLFPKRDAAAKKALEAYALAVKDSNAELAQQLTDWLSAT